MYVIATRPIGDFFFAKYSSSGIFTLEGCSVKLGEPFASWESPGNVWNYTFIELKTGSFNFTNTDFTNIIVSETNTFISCVVESEKILTIDGCTFTGCGCINEGNVIDVSSSSVSTSTDSLSLSVINSDFISCFGYKGGIFSLKKQRGCIGGCVMKNVSASSLGGCLFVTGGCVLEIKECKFEDIYSLRDGGVLYGESGSVLQGESGGSVKVIDTEIKNVYSKIGGGFFTRKV
jgi:hypothetical protein